MLVVDRSRWVQASAEGFAELAEPLEQRLANAKGVTPWARAIGSRVTGIEVGGLLAFMSHKVLGQFDPFSGDDTADGGRTGRLLLVAPNIVHAERELEADADDFRMWVCLHEETHRLQFGGVPWLGGHLRAQVGRLADDHRPRGLRRPAAGRPGTDDGGADRPRRHRGVAARPGAVGRSRRWWSRRSPRSCRCWRATPTW